MYTISLYFVTESAFCVGFGDLDILQSSLNRQLAIFLMISGSFMTFLALGFRENEPN